MKAINYFGMMMAAAAITACTSDELVSIDGNTSPETKDNVMQFSVKNKNITRAIGLESTGHYNFGVWGRKGLYNQGGTALDGDRGKSEIMNNYLVGWAGDAKGYDVNATTATTVPNGTPTNPDGNNGTSYWFYEGLGTAQYGANSTPATGYYLKNQQKYMSNNEYQYLKYWDHSTKWTAFYAYAPYVHANTPGTDDVEFNYDANGSSVMKFNKAITNKAVEKGEDHSLYEYMYAEKLVRSEDYNNDVQLQFHRLGAKVRIAFYENIPGYYARIINLDGTTGVTAQPAVEWTTGKWKKGQIAYSANPEITFKYDYNANATSITPTVDYKYNKRTAQYLTFTKPDGKNLNDPAVAPYTGLIKDGARPLASEEQYYSPTTYYVLPSDATNKNAGLRFHMSYEIIAMDTKEVIRVVDADVFVPAEYTDWQANTFYTYIFKITKNSTGSTDDTVTPDPDGVEPGTPGLFPIVFDGVEVEDYLHETSTWLVNGDNPEEVEKDDINTKAQITLNTTISPTQYVNDWIRINAKTSVDPTYVGKNVKCIIDVTNADYVNLQYYERDPSKPTYGTYVDVPRSGTSFIFMESGFPLTDTGVLKLRIKSSKVCTIKGTARLIGVDTDIKDKTVSSCDIDLNIVAKP